MPTMRTVAQKPDANHQTTSAESTRPGGPPHLGQGREVNSLLHLQRTIGNHAVQRLFGLGSITGLPENLEDYMAGQAAGTVAGGLSGAGSGPIAMVGQKEGLPSKLLLHYMYGSGRPFHLSLAQMQECNPAFTFEPKSQELKTPGSRRIHSSTTAVALLNGTLGQFTVRYSGDLTVSAGGSWRFVGRMLFFDFYDFDVHLGSSGRSSWGNLASGVGSTIDGTPFAVISEQVAVHQDEHMKYPSWGSGFSPNPADRSGNPETVLQNRVPERS